MKHKNVKRVFVTVRAKALNGTWVRRTAYVNAMIGHDGKARVDHETYKDLVAGLGVGRGATITIE